jgi:uncharacterized membrane protein
MAITTITGLVLASSTGISATYAFFIGFTLLSVIPLLILRHQKRIIRISGKSIRFYLAISLFSFFLYLFLTYIRSFKTDILGTEKLMDVALITTILKQDKLPIENPWLSGFIMNYYYAGHYLLAMLHKLVAVPANIGYNLAIGLVGVWIFQGTWAILFKLTKHVFWTYLFAITTTFGGNYFIFYELYVQGKETSWFASATRVIPYTINEFPSYSIVLGDLHGHYLSLPFFIVTIYFMLVLWKWLVKRNLFSVGKSSLVLGILLGFLYLINSWDVITLAILGAVLSVAILYVKRDALTKMKSAVALGKRFGVLLLGIATPALAVFLYSRTMFLPPVAGIGINTAFTEIDKFLQLFAHFLIAGFVAFLGRFLFAKYLKGREISSRFMQSIALIIVGLIIVAAVEFFYAKDIFHILNPPYSRTNTVFKFYYHAWILFSVGLFTMLTVIMSSLEIFHKSLFVKFVYMNILLLLSVSMIAYFSIAVGQFIAPKFTGESLERFYNPTYQDGYGYVNITREDDRGIIDFLLQKEFTTILEFTDYESYSYNARVASYTGHTTVQGWPLHNVQWYGGYDGSGMLTISRQREKMPVAERVNDIQTMYQSKDSEVVRALLQKYDITYVVFGEREKAFADKNTIVDRFSVYDNLCSIVWSKNESRIYNCK